MGNRIYFATSLTGGNSGALDAADPTGPVNAQDYNITVNRLNDLLLKLQQSGINTNEDRTDNDI